MASVTSYLVGAGAGTPELLTRAAAARLERAHVVICEAAVGEELLELCPPERELLFCPRDQLLSLMLERARRGESVVGVVMGNPLSDPELRARLAELAAEPDCPQVLVGVEPAAAREAHQLLSLRPLFGRRLLSLRALEQSRETRDAIRARGAEPVLCPLIRICPPPDPEALNQAMRSLGQYQWVLFTSRNGAARCAEALDALGLDARAFGAARIGVIGPETLVPLARLGLRADLVASAHVAECFARELLEAGCSTRALLVRAEEAREILPEVLRRADVCVDVVAAYRTEPLTAESRGRLKELMEAGNVDAALVTSSSIAHALADALGPDGPALGQRVVLASIGPVTSEALRSRGLGVGVEASRYTVEGLLDALSQHFLQKK